MITFSIEPVVNCNYTPAWIKPERYLYCDDFARDLAGSTRASVLAAIRKLLHR